MEPSLGTPVAIAIGLVLVVLGAVGATAMSRAFDTAADPRWVPLRLVPFGILIGGGASLVRAWDLAAGILVGAVLVPVIATAARLIEVRRRRHRRDDADRR